MTDCLPAPVGTERAPWCSNVTADLWKISKKVLCGCVTAAGTSERRFGYPIQLRRPPSCPRKPTVHLVYSTNTQGQTLQVLQKRVSTSRSHRKTPLRRKRTINHQRGTTMMYVVTSDSFTLRLSRIIATPRTSYTACHNWHSNPF